MESHGGHPNEIFRGGNPTHISLYPQKSNGGYTFHLTSGQIITSRAIEAVNAYYALVQAGYPVEMAHLAKVKDVLKGEDYIGIVPFDVTPRYCASMFPDEDNVNDYMRLSSLLDDEDTTIQEALLSKIKWYPETPLELA